MGLIKARPQEASASATALPPAPTAALDADDPQQRRDALRASVGDAAALPAVIARLPLEQDPHVRSVLISTLVESQSDDAAQALAALLSVEDVALRNLAITALAEMPTAAMKLLPGLLDNADADVRIFATSVLGAIGGPRAAELLAWLLGHDPHVNVIDAAINGLVETGSREHIKALQAARRRFADDPYVGFAVKAAISALERAPLAH